ncbi:hypothetical protein [Colwellia ponticola]|uniref:Uncharacterized protein n=1 Tax=Colwellia ponticola TaxID=2304625 RepID=A0A8H2JPW6_9GAMM|nr:hypothetical protein [Colwellia ponticola]TMM47914.1 hypothetical protein FCS21_02835 [Colwellia ponticola]
MINNLGLYNSATVNNTVSQKDTAEVTAVTVKDTTNVIKSETSTGVDNSIYLSSRAQKINVISTEFFSGAQLSFDDIDALKEKLYQFGLISKGDYDNLTGSKVNASEAQASTSTTTLTSFLGDFIERLNSDETDDNTNTESDTDTDDSANGSETIKVLTAALTSAKAMLSNIEEQKLQPDFQSTLKSTLALLNETISDPSFESLPLEDKVGLSKVHQTLEIVDRLSPQRLNNDKVNQYIKLAFK